MVSLMIGTVVEKVSCADYLPTDDNSTVSTALFDSELQCRVWMATAVTFLSAMFQVGIGLLEFYFARVFQSAIHGSNPLMSAMLANQSFPYKCAI